VNFKKPLVVAFVMIAAACSSSSSSTNTPPSDVEPDGYPKAGVSAKGLTLRTVEFAVPAGDAFECPYTDLTTTEELFVNNSVGLQMEGGHHITVYYTNVKQPPGHHPCVDAEMTEWRQVAGSAGDDKNGGEGRVGLPPGVAIKVPAGKQIVMQTHYINTSGKERMAKDVVTVQLLRREEVKHVANAYVLVDDQFKIPPQANYERVSTCTISKDLNVLLLLGHMHELGSVYKLERIDEKGNALETLVEHKWQASYTSHPPTKNFTPEAPLVLKKGTRLRQTCKWNNTTTEQLRFPREMCVTFGYYFPDDGFTLCEMEMPKE
jgi:hypothetical protein